MTKKEFVGLMERYLELRENVRLVNNAFRGLDPDFASFGLSKHENLFFDTLRIAVNDQYDWISYWLFELDCGKKWKKDMIQEKDGTDICLKTLSDLYNCIKKLDDTGHEEMRVAVGKCTL